MKRLCVLVAIGLFGQFYGPEAKAQTLQGQLQSEVVLRDGRITDTATGLQFRKVCGIAGTKDIIEFNNGSHRGRFSAYLFQIAKNHFLDKSRNRKSHIDVQRICCPEPAESLHQVSLSSGGYSEAVVNEIRGAVSEAMARLPEIHRLVYVLSEEQAMSYKEIADILECPVGTVSSQREIFGLFVSDCEEPLPGQEPKPEVPH